MYHIWCGTHDTPHTIHRMLQVSILFHLHECNAIFWIGFEWIVKKKWRCLCLHRATCFSSISLSPSLLSLHTMNVLIIYNWFFSFLYVVFQNSAFLFLCFQFFFDRPRAQKLFSLFLVSGEVLSVLFSSSLFHLLLSASSVRFQVRASRHRALVRDAAFRVNL